MISTSSLDKGYLGHTVELFITLEATFLVKISLKLVRKILKTLSRSSLNMGYPWSKTT
jgi:hypothetical protein